MAANQLWQSTAAARRLVSSALTSSISAASRRNLSSSPAPAAMRFIQFETTTPADGACSKDAAPRRLGLISEDGRQMVDLTAECPHMTDMIAFIRAGDAALERLRAKSAEFKWQPLTEAVRLVAPVTAPEKIVCIGLNYLGHCKEQGKEAPKEPMFFSKFNNALVGPTDDVIAHKVTEEIDWEVELAVIIGKRAHHVAQADAMDHVFGYSVAQDISARDWQKRRNGGQFLIGKSMDTFCPLGPAVVHKSLVADPHRLAVECDVNGVSKQRGNTDELIFRIDAIVHLLSQTITLQPGDVILTGTPSGVGMHRKPAEFLKPGDLIESRIESIGTISNRVVADC